MRLTAAGQRLNCTAFPFNHQNGTSWQTIIDIFFKCECKGTAFFAYMQEKREKSFEVSYFSLFDGFSGLLSASLTLRSSNDMVT